MGFSPSPRSNIVGFKFDPSDQELLSYFLYNKVTGKSLDFYRGFVFDFDLYGPNQPDQIWDLFGGSFLRQDEDLYFFMTLSFKSKGKAKGSCGSRISRTISSGGTWSNEGSKVIYDAHGSLPIGIKRWFHYENSQSPQNGCWIMHEFTLDVEGSSLPLSSSDQAVVASSVLCRLRRNDQAKTTSRKRKVQPQPQSLPQQDCPRKKQRAAEYATTTDASDDTLPPLIPVSNQHSVIHIDAIASTAAATASGQTHPPMVTISDPVSESEFGHEGQAEFILDPTQNQDIFNTNFDDEDFCSSGDLDQFLNEFLGDLTDCGDILPLPHSALLL